jgi:hypothetical protein
MKLKRQQTKMLKTMNQDENLGSLSQNEMLRMAKEKPPRTSSIDIFIGMVYFTIFFFWQVVTML